MAAAAVAVAVVLLRGKEPEALAARLEEGVAEVAVVKVASRGKHQKRLS